MEGPKLHLPGVRAAVKLKKAKIQVSVQVFKADVVLASYEAVCSDANLQAISWNLVIVDERKRMRSALSKVYVSLADFEVKHRLLISSSHSSQVSALLLFLKKQVRFP